MASIATDDRPAACAARLPAGRCAAVVTAIAIAAPSCVETRAVFECTSSAQCAGDSPGTCEPTGYCSFLDDSCASRRRYGPGAPASLRETCVDPATSGRIGDWSPAGEIRATRNHASTLHRGRLYVVGGIGSLSLALADVQVASFSDAGVGSFEMTTPLPEPRFGPSVVAHGDFLFVIGGSLEGGGAPAPSVLVAPILPDGSLGAWTQGGPELPGPRKSHAAASHGDHVYVLGGDLVGELEGAVLNDVQVAQVDSSGQLGPWSAMATFPSPRHGHALAVADDRLYVIAGCNATRTPGCADSELADIQVAEIDPDGSVARWSVAGSLPGPRRDHAAVAYDSTLYVLGGSATQQYEGIALSAPIAADGSLGTFLPTTEIPGGRHRATAHADFDRIVVLGGRDDLSVMVAELEAE